MEQQSGSLEGVVEGRWGDEGDEGVWGVWGVWGGRGRITNAQCPMPNAQCPINFIV